MTTSPLLDDNLDAVFYEVLMMNRAFDICSTPPTDVENNAALEVFLLHVRNLTEFFCVQSKKYPDDLRVYDFSDHTGSPLGVVSMPSSVKISDLNKRLSHLTKTRSQGSVKWPYHKMLMEMNQIVNQFISQVNGGTFRTRRGRTKKDFLHAMSGSTVQVWLPTYGSTA